MKIAYFDAFAGISGDMFLGALLDAGFKQSNLKRIPKLLNLKTCKINIKRVKRNNISALSVNVKENNTKHKHRKFKDLKIIVERAKIDKEIKEKSIEILKKLVSAEAKVHKESKEKVTFHEIGKLDTLIDIVGTLIGLKELGVDKVISSPLPLTRGFVSTAHGKLPLPAPAALQLLKNVPVYNLDVVRPTRLDKKSQDCLETVTPTGAAIITSIASDFSNFPCMNIKKCGYGAGNNKLPVPNLLRIVIGNIKEDILEEKVMLIETNIDDMNPKYYDYVMERLFKEGALDVFLTPIIMKKNRPATALSIMCKKKDVSKMYNILFKETTTIGVRITEVSRKKLERKEKKLNTPYGKIKVKAVYLNGTLRNVIPDYDTCKKIAVKKKQPLQKIISKIKKHIK